MDITAISRSTYYPLKIEDDEENLYSEPESSDEEVEPIVQQWPNVHFGD